MSERVKGANTGEEWRELRAEIERSWTPVWSRFPRCNATFGPLTTGVEDFLEGDGYSGRYFIDTDISPNRTLIPGRILFENADAAFHFKMFWTDNL